MGFLFGDFGGLGPPFQVFVIRSWILQEQASKWDEASERIQIGRDALSEPGAAGKG